MSAHPRRRTVLLGLGALPLLPLSVQAQASWPTREVRIVVPLPAGGAPDLFVRGLAEGLRPQLGQSVVVDNRPGASGLIGSKAVSGAAPDGHTLAYIHSGLVTVQAITPRLDLLKEFKMIARLTASPFALVVRTESPYKTAQDLIAAVRAQPGKLSYGSAGVGSPAHLATEMVEERVGNFQALHVPYKGAIETAQAIVGGQVDFSIALLGTVMPLVQSGKLRILGVTSRQRLPMLPQTPTLAESGFPGYVFESWGGLAAPAGTPDAVIARLNKVLPEVMASAAIKELVLKNGSVIEYQDAKALTDHIAQALPIDRALVKRLDIRAE